MPEGDASFGQVVRRQLNRHPVTSEDPDVMLPHLTGQVGQHFVTLAYFYFECSVTHTFNHSSIDRDHVFFWNDVTSFPRSAQAAAYKRVFRFRSQ